jgi:ABC-type uncharacterized transport system ATPase subunit
MKKFKVDVMCRLDVGNEKCIKNFKNKIKNCVQDVNLKTSNERLMGDLGINGRILFIGEVGGI